MKALICGYRPPNEVFSLLNRLRIDKNVTDIIVSAVDNDNEPSSTEFVITWANLYKFPIHIWFEPLGTILNEAKPDILLKLSDSNNSLELLDYIVENETSVALCIH